MKLNFYRVPCENNKKKKKKSKKKRKKNKFEESESGVNENLSSQNSDDTHDREKNTIKSIRESVSSQTTSNTLSSLPFSMPLLPSFHMPSFISFNDDDDSDDVTKRDSTKAEYMDDNDIAYEAYKEVLSELKTKIDNQNKFSIFKGFDFLFFGLIFNFRLHDFVLYFLGQHTVFDTSSTSSEGEEDDKKLSNSNQRSSTTIEIGTFQSDNDESDEDNNENNLNNDNSESQDNNIEDYDDDCHTNENNNNKDNNNNVFDYSQFFLQFSNETKQMNDNVLLNPSNSNNIEMKNEMTSSSQQHSNDENSIHGTEENENFSQTTHIEQDIGKEDKNLNTTNTLDSNQLEESNKEHFQQTEDSISMDAEIHRYWKKRYYLFSKFDAGIKMDKGQSLFLNLCYHL